MAEDPSFSATKTEENDIRINCFGRDGTGKVSLMTSRYAGPAAQQMEGLLERVYQTIGSKNARRMAIRSLVGKREDGRLAGTMKALRLESMDGWIEITDTRGDDGSYGWRLSVEGEETARDFSSSEDGRRTAVLQAALQVKSDRHQTIWPETIFQMK